MITLYHGTTQKSAKNIYDNGINLNCNQRRALDFGPGFYTHIVYEWAEKWAVRKARYANDKAAVVTICVNEQELFKMVKLFEDNIEWGQFIINNRNGYPYINKVFLKDNNINGKYDITCGRIADCEVIDIAENLKLNGKPLEDLSLIFNKEYPVQYAFHTENGLSCIKKITYRNL